MLGRRRSSRRLSIWTELAGEKNNAYLSMIPWMIIQVNERRTVGLVREPLLLEARGSSNLFSIVNSVNILKGFSISLSVITVLYHQLLQKEPSIVNGSSTVALERHTLKLEARRSTTLLNIVTWVGFWKEHCLSLSVFKGEEHQLWAKEPLSSDRRNTLILIQYYMLEGRGSSSLLSIMNWVCCIRE
jgi:hypothetical protein